TNGDRYKWTGREFDSESGLQYNRARYYNPLTGQWTTEDLLGFSAGDSNLHRYAGNNVANATDPSGGIVITIHGVWSGGTPWSFERAKMLRDYWNENDLRVKGEASTLSGLHTVLRYQWTGESGGKPPVWDGNNNPLRIKGYQKEEAKRFAKFINDLRNL